MVDSFFLRIFLIVLIPGLLRRPRSRTIRTGGS
jgi:hypothetical protein